MNFEKDLNNKMMDTSCYAPIPVWKLDNDQKKEINLLEELEKELAKCETQSSNKEDISKYKKMKMAVRSLIKDLNQVNELFSQYAKEHALPLNHLLVVDYRRLQQSYFELEFQIRGEMNKLIPNS